MPEQRPLLFDLFYIDDTEITNSGISSNVEWVKEFHCSDKIGYTSWWIGIGPDDAV